MRKGQSATEYLMTYGWAILAIAIVGALLYTQVFSQKDKVNETQEEEIWDTHDAERDALISALEPYGLTETQKVWIESRESVVMRDLSVGDKLLGVVITDIFPRY